VRLQLNAQYKCSLTNIPKWDVKGRCHGNHLKSKNLRFLPTNLVCRAAISKYCTFDFKTLNGMNFNASCIILVRFYAAKNIVDVKNVLRVTFFYVFFAFFYLSHVF